MRIKVSKEIDLDFLKNYRNAQFKVKAEAYDEKNNLISNEKTFDVKSKQFPYSDKELFTYKDISEKNSKYHTIEIQSIRPNLHITSRYYIDEKLTNDVKTIQLVTGKTVFKFNKNELYKKNVTFHFSTIWENEGYEKFYQVSRETAENKLQIEIESLRNKIEPESQENWSFKILNQKLETEILASMYDSSLDQFATSNWGNVSFYNNPFYPDTPKIKNQQQTAYFNITNFKTEKKRFFLIII